MNQGTAKKGSVLFIILFASLLHLPFAFSSTATTGKVSFSNSVTAPVVNVANTLNLLYSKLELSSKGLSQEAYDYAVKGYSHLKEIGKISKGDVLTIVDFSRPSNEKRLYVIDVEEEKVLFNTYVAHGRGSGEKMANRFSNVPESFQSSLGFYSTSSTYQGKHGYSLKLSGLEPGFNNLAEHRAIVIHSADYVSEGFIRTKGYLGRSWGCPALPAKLNKPIIDEIKNGSCLFIYSPNQKYLRQSKILNA